MFPVEIEITSDSKNSSKLLQGFTRDIGEGGICVELKSFGHTFEKSLATPEAFLKLTINPPFLSKPVFASGKIAWSRREDAPTPYYILGVAYTAIDPGANRRMLDFARRLIWLPRGVAMMGLILLACIAFLSARDFESRRENTQLVHRLVESAQKKSEISAELDGIRQVKARLEADLKKARGKIDGLQTSLELEKKLSTQLKKISEGEAKLESAYRSLAETGLSSAARVRERMVAWLRSHQNRLTGLVASFEGDGALKDWAFTYDQSLASQVFLLFGDTERAAQLLEFYRDRAQRKDGVFYNAYDAVQGGLAEATLHCGPNIWLGIAALQYGSKTGDKQFLPLAEDIGNWLIRAQDAEGGLKGGPDVSWYSTEHNLDAYAFFGMLFQVTGDEKYRAAQRSTLEWLRKYAYSIKEQRMNRGKGDATIATDTFSWAIAAVGPQTLGEAGFDAEAIMQFAEDNCAVTVDYSRPDGQKMPASGFDFAKARHVGRGGVISTEWTAQMTVSYTLLADYFYAAGNKEKAVFYANKAAFYLNELQKFVITSPSRTGQGQGCLPYASMDDVDTGHGWRTPKGKSTGSVAGTSYGLFAWSGYNPFDLNENREEVHADLSFQR